ncbi:DUF1289 domain-containing protein [Alphaproteobacteria bacterium]|nr:DUF1289 domain-containing protein [Alphaproteobacteria bacterium]
MRQIRKKSPCIGVCKIDTINNLCIGCLRSIDEIAMWSQMDDKRALEILEETKSRSLQKKPYKIFRKKNA